MGAQNLVPGRIVYFVFDEYSAHEVNRRRSPSDVGTDKWPKGAIAHVGNTVGAGDIAPAMVVRFWDERGVNLKVFLDGDDTFWATSVSYDEAKAPRTWHWMFAGQAERYNPATVGAATTNTP